MSEWDEELRELPRPPGSLCPICHKILRDANNRLACTSVAIKKIREALRLEDDNLKLMKINFAIDWLVNTSLYDPKTPEEWRET